MAGLLRAVDRKRRPDRNMVPRFSSPLRSLSLMGVLEWTESDHLRHSKSAGLREDKNARSVVKEHGGEV